MSARIRSVLSVATLVVFAMSGPIGCATATGPRPAMATRPLLRGPSRETRETDAPLDSSVRTQVIEGALEQLADNYVFPDVARAIDDAVRARARRGEYDAIKSSTVFARTLTAHLRDVNHDRHLSVEYSAASVPSDGDPDAPDDPVEEERRARWQRSVNYGFEKVEILEGNVGYLELRGFLDPTLGGETAAAAMTFVAGTDALIIDLRRNEGGTPEMVQLLSSYLLDGDPTHLNDLYWRRAGTTQQFWTLPFVPGKRFGQTKPLYILTSKSTFSAAEAFAYTLQALKRATVVGETTGGGAHPGNVHRLAEHFRMIVPSGRAIDPRTHTNWEGTGVKPDIEAPANQALLAAQVPALKACIEKNKEPEQVEELRRLVRETQAKLDGLTRGAK